MYTKNVHKNMVQILHHQILRNNYYKISDEYNLKLYKPEVINIDEMERRVDGIVRAGVDSNFDSYNYGQDCFIPVKKAYNDHKQFVGYIYETVNFNGESNNLCVDLKT